MLGSLAQGRKSEWPELEHYGERGSWSSWELPEHLSLSSYGLRASPKCLSNGLL